MTKNHEPDHSHASQPSQRPGLQPGPGQEPKHPPDHKPDHTPDKHAPPPPKSPPPAPEPLSEVELGKPVGWKDTPPPSLAQQQGEIEPLVTLASGIIGNPIAGVLSCSVSPVGVWASLGAYVTASAPLPPPCQIIL